MKLFKAFTELFFKKRIVKDTINVINSIIKLNDSSIII